MLTLIKKKDQEDLLRTFVTSRSHSSCWTLAFTDIRRTGGVNAITQLTAPYSICVTWAH